MGIRRGERLIAYRRIDGKKKKKEKKLSIMRARFLTIIEGKLNIKRKLKGISFGLVD